MASNKDDCWVAMLIPTDSSYILSANWDGHLIMIAVHPMCINIHIVCIYVYQWRTKLLTARNGHGQSRIGCECFRTNFILSVTHILYILIEDKINKPLNHPSPRYTQRSDDISFGSKVHSFDAWLVITSYWLQYEWSSKHINTWPGNAYLGPSLGICCIFFHNIGNCLSTETRPKNERTVPKKIIFYCACISTKRTLENRIL